MAKAKPNPNVALAQKFLSAQEKAAIALAKVDLVRAQIEVKGKQISYDYSKDKPVLKVVDRQKAK